MPIQPIASSRLTPVSFRANDNQIFPIEEDIEQKSDKPSKFTNSEKIGAVAFASALAAATITGGIMHGKLRSTEKVLNGKIKDINSTYGELDKLNKKLQDEIKKTTEKFNALFEQSVTPKDMPEDVYGAMKSTIEKADYGYDITTPPVTGKRIVKTKMENAIDLPQVGTTNRSFIKELNIPEISESGKFDYELPMSDEVKITHMKSADFKPVKSQPTNVSENYADSVKWDNDKIARDVLQNFFDGHGQTLDGVKLHFEPVAGGRYKVRIEGKSTYTPDKAVYIGESTKRENSKAAGNYGEGLKMATLKLLKDKDAKNVKIGSDNWNLTYTLEKGNLSDARVLTYSLDKAPKMDGNYLEFETSDKNLLTSLRNTIQRFYNSGNPHFRCPDFENDKLAVKILPKGEKGGFYMSGQRFEFDGKYDGLDGVVFMLKEKPPKAILDPSRDRVSLNSSDLENIAKWVAKDKNMPDEEKAKLINTLQNYWEEKGYFADGPMDKFLNMFLLYSDGKLNINFPENCVAYSNASNELIRDLGSKGYKICKDGFSGIGMKTVRDLCGDMRKHDVVIPNDIQKKKILILKEALRKLSPSLKSNPKFRGFTDSELDAHIYMFDRNAPKEKRNYSDTLAEAITDLGSSKGFWIDKSYLSEANFADVLETALHELSHKAGGDESSAFSYMLTNVNKQAIGQMMNDPECRAELLALNKLWKMADINAAA